jgi:hypothetical protein
LIGIQLAVEATSDLGIGMTVEAEYGQVTLNRIARILIYMMNLHGLTRCPADAACAICFEEHECGKIGRQ